MNAEFRARPRITQQTRNERLNEKREVLQRDLGERLWMHRRGGAQLLEDGDNRCDGPC